MPAQRVADDPTQDGFTDDPVGDGFTGHTVTYSVDAEGTIWLPLDVNPEPECTARLLPLARWYLLVVRW
jgi:hypothetical protein